MLLQHCKASMRVNCMKDLRIRRSTFACGVCLTHYVSEAQCWKSWKSLRLSQHRSCRPRGIRIMSNVLDFRNRQMAYIYMHDALQCDLNGHCVYYSAEGYMKRTAVGNGSGGGSCDMQWGNRKGDQGCGKSHQSNVPSRRGMINGSSKNILFGVFKIKRSYDAGAAERTAFFLLCYVQQELGQRGVRTCCWGVNQVVRTNKFFRVYLFFRFISAEKKKKKKHRSERKVHVPGG